MLTTLRERGRGQEGFTLIELLVVILIIGILAAIAIPNFLGQTQKAQDASAKSNVRNAVSAMESCFTDQQTYTGCTLAGSGITQTTGTTQGAVKVNITDSGAAYNLIGYSRSSASFTATRAVAGTFSYSCTPTGGGCPSGGDWGSL